METLKDILGLPPIATEREVRLAAENARLAEEWVMADDDRARAFVKARPLIIAARGRGRTESGPAKDGRRACWTCRHAPTLDSCERRSYTRVMAAWIRDNIDDNLHPIPTARNCPGYEDKP